MKILPITTHKDEIVKAVRANDVTIIVGETGSGKSTQVPQYLAEIYDQVIVTEPRIMAAKTLARRVSDEMGVVLGDDVGYRTGYDKCDSQNSKILFCTDGLQLIRTITQSKNNANNVLIIDEIHEWNNNMEALAAWCKYMLDKWNTKVVIMSATVDAEALKNYYGGKVSVIKVPGNLYEVSFEERNECEFVSTILEKVYEGKNVLAFVSGKKEINDTIKELMDNFKLNQTAVKVFPLHGELEWEEQSKCFDSYDVPKVIVATNVAQTSVTIPDINVVVDTGKAKITIARNGIEGLFEVNISQADCLQRKGRAGRVQNGEYILCSDVCFEYRDRYMAPEIQRSILDRVVLQLAVAGIDAEKLEFFHQPKKSAIQIAKNELYTLGALDLECNVTELGHKMVKMPVSVQLARMIVEAEKFGVTEDVMTIAAIIEMGGLLSKDGSYSNFTSESRSDLLAELDVWNKISELGWIDFKEYGINKKTFFRIKEHIKKLKEALGDIVEISSSNNREGILRSCLSGMVSNIFTRDCWEEYVDSDGNTRRLDKKSCVSGYSYGSNLECVVGTPRTIEFNGRWGEKRRLELISFVTAFDKQYLLELCPEQITSETEIIGYNPEKDAVELYRTRYFRRLRIDGETIYDKNHPSYEALKNDYEFRERGYRSVTKEDVVENVVNVCGKKFDVFSNAYPRYYYINVDVDTLYSGEDTAVQLKNGEYLYFKYTCQFGSFKYQNLLTLRNAVEMRRVESEVWKKTDYYSGMKSKTLKDVMNQMDALGEVIVTYKNGGNSDEPVIRYGCIRLSGKTVSFDLRKEKGSAEEDTKEALQFLFKKEVETRYPVGRFSSMTGKKKKKLTPEENEMKMEFDSLVRELLRELRIDNVEESLEFLEEFFQEMMAKKTK